MSHAKEILVMTGRTTLAESLEVISAWKTSHDELAVERAEVEALRAEADRAERVGLMARLDPRDSMTKAAAKMPLDDLRQLVAAQKGARVR